MDNVDIVSSERSINELEEYLIRDIGMNEKRVHNTFKKFYNVYKIK